MDDDTEAESPDDDVQRKFDRDFELMTKLAMRISNKEAKVKKMKDGDTRDDDMEAEMVDSDATKEDEKKFEQMRTWQDRVQKKPELLSPRAARVQRRALRTPGSGNFGDKKK